MDLTDALELPPAAADEAVALLVRLRLLQPAVDGEGWVCVAPDSAAARLLAPAEQEAHRRQLALEEVRSTLRGLAPVYASATRGGRRGSLELITDVHAVRELLTELAACCEHEVLTSQPGGGRPIDHLEDAVTRDEDMLRRGVGMRSIYQHSARYNPPAVAYAERVAALGGQVRTHGDGLVRMIIFDRTTGIMGVRQSSGAALVVRDPDVVAFMIAAFDRAWLASLDFPTGYAREEAKAVSRDIKHVITKLLAEGFDDKSIARRIGVSERTCQRHISEIMTQLGAASRFQAGFLLRGGLPDGDDPQPRRS
ncbi:helix-turn-helix transcriptional regulator [Kitasatospora sp. GAS204B]|uniref:helix-turn-helix transcriptional regulator n=1 Tax=unclassified Kitasatospora TaxID=2633591 RepID=UPI0024747FB6|nr:helix-turn-helix transcriptional regulator [Kitasatospora sp. GAS204B]